MLSILRRLFSTRDPDATAAKQQGDPQALDTPGDPRGGLQSEEYRRSDPREVVEEDGTAMSGAGGTPQEGTTAEERRAQQRRDGLSG